jgi:NAD(P)-dependent dehydrogenase (short-subunit alcohol dehydrogenase family)
MLDVTEELLERVIAINLKSVFWGSVAAGRAMKAQGGGSIINISSTGAISAPPNMSVYAMTKSGVSAVTRNIAKELGAFGVRANTVSPGFVETKLASWSYRKDDGSVDEGKRDEALRLRRQRVDIGLAADVGAKRGGACRLDGLGQSRLVDVADHYARAGLRERLRRLPADARRRARHHRHAVLQAEPVHYRHLRSPDVLFRLSWARAGSRCQRKFRNRE